MELPAFPSSSPERKGEKKRKFKIQVILKKYILKSTLEATKHKWLEQLKKKGGKKHGVKIVDSFFFSYKLKQEKA